MHNSELPLLTSIIHTTIGWILAEVHFMRKTAGYAISEHKRNLKIVTKLHIS
jgi:hypothetical protein